MSRASPSSPPHSVAGALFLARQWPVQLSPVPGGIIDPQTVQTTTSAWNQAKWYGALEELFRMDALETGKATSSQQRPGSKAASATHLPHLAPYLENPHLITQKNTPTEEIYPNRRNIPFIQMITEIYFLKILFYILVQKHQLHCLLRKPLLK